MFKYDSFFHTTGTSLIWNSGKGLKESRSLCNEWTTDSASGVFVYFILNVRAAIESLFERLILLLLEDSNKQSAENFDEILLENSNKQKCRKCSNKQTRHYYIRLGSSSTTSRCSKPPYNLYAYSRPISPPFPCNTVWERQLSCALRDCVTVTRHYTYIT